MLRAGGMEEFVTEEDEPWYDQRDLEQGESMMQHQTAALQLEFSTNKRPLQEN